MGSLLFKKIEDPGADVGRTGFALPFRVDITAIRELQSSCSSSRPAELPRLNCRLGRPSEKQLRPTPSPAIVSHSSLAPRGLIAKTTIGGRASRFSSRPRHLPMPTRMPVFILVCWQACRMALGHINPAPDVSSILHVTKAFPASGASGVPQNFSSCRRACAIARLRRLTACRRTIRASHRSAISSARPYRSYRGAQTRRQEHIT